MDENDVEMESEKIVVNLETGSVDCSFVFHNTGESKDRWDLSDIELMISHKENDTPVIDGKFDTSSCYVDLKPGVEYDISCTIRDWMDCAFQNNIKYMAPEPVLSEAQGVDEFPAAEQDAVQAAVQEATESKPSNKTSLTIWIISGVVLAAAGVFSLKRIKST